MKTLQSFKASRFYFAMAAAITVGLLLAKVLSAFDFHVNSLTAAFVAAGLVAVVFSILFENRNWE